MVGREGKVARTLSQGAVAAAAAARHMSLISLRVYSYLLRLICQLRPNKARMHTARVVGRQGEAVAGVCRTKSPTIAAIEKVQRELGSASRLSLVCT